MKPYYYLLLIGFPLAGGLIAYYSKVQKLNNFRLVLAFGGAYLLSVVLFHFIPHLYTEMNVWSGILLLAGFFFQLFIERFSRGVEHGHLHLHKHTKLSAVVPYEILISLCLHSFMEGLPLGSDFLLNDSGKLSFLFGIVLHEFPAAFAMVSILKGQSFNRTRILLFIAIYACMSTMGVLSSQTLTGWLSTHILEYIMAFVVGTFLHIATTILFENSENHKFTTGKIVAILLGIILAATVSLTF